MNNRINIVSGMFFAAISEIEEFTILNNISVQVAVAAWHAIPYVKGSVEPEINKVTEKGAVIHTTDLQVKINESIEIPPCIVRLDFEDGDSLIIGEAEIPVIFNTGNTLTRKIIETTHISWHKPYILVD